MTAPLARMSAAGDVCATTAASMTHVPAGEDTLQFGPAAPVGPVGPVASTVPGCAVGSRLSRLQVVTPLTVEHQLVCPELAGCMHGQVRTGRDPTISCAFTHT